MQVGRAKKLKKIFKPKVEFGRSEVRLQARVDEVVFAALRDAQVDRQRRSVPLVPLRRVPDEAIHTVS